MLKLDNLTERDVEWIIVAVEAIAALPSTSHPEDKSRQQEWKDLVAKLKGQHPEVAKKLDIECFRPRDL